MKTTQKITMTCLASVILMFTGCTKDDFDILPTTVLPVNESLETPTHVAAWGNGFYSRLRTRSYGIYMYATDLQSDMVSASRSFGNRQGGVHRWDFTSDDYTIRDIWAGYYSGIANVNYFLSRVDNVPAATDAEKSTISTAKSEAYFFRAYYYFNLILRYAKAYDSLTAATDLGVPIVTEIDINARPVRSSIADVYTLIINDLDAAEDYATTDKYTDLNKVGRHAIKALRARVALCMQDWALAATLSEELVGKYTLAASLTELGDVWKNDANTSEVIFRLTAIKTLETPNTNSVYLGSATWYAAYNLVYYQPDFYPSAKAVAMFESADWRRSAYFKTAYIAYSGKLKVADVISKYAGNPALYTNSLQSNFQHGQIIFRAAEQLLIYAESSYMMGDNVAALAGLKALQAHRGCTETPASTTGDDLFAAIQLERTRELMYEGFRLDDLKRWNLPCTRGVSFCPDYSYTGLGYSELDKPSGDDKFVWAIPRNDETTNKNIVQNPGW